MGTGQHGIRRLHPLRLLALGGVATLMAGCHPVGPDYVMPKGAAYNSSAAQGKFKDADTHNVNSDAQLPVNWWKLYQSEQLDHLIELALENNTSLRVAAANLEKSRAELASAMSAGSFDASTSASYQRTGLSGEQYLQQEHLSPINLATASLDISYQLDLWGKIKRGVEAASADDDAVQAANDLARINVVARVTSSYMDICSANHEYAVANHQLALQKDSREVTRRLVAAGRGSPTDIERADALVASQTAVLPVLKARRQASEYQLADLLGQAPNQLPEGVAQCAQAPQLEQPIPVGDGRALLARRPDVREAERKLAAATARIGVATADLYPSISLGASAGIVGEAEDFGQRRTQSWGLGPLISWHIPGRQDRARILIARAGAKAQLASFDATVFNALREVQTALSQYAQDSQRLDDLREARDHSATAAAQSQRLYRAGRAPYLDSLDADRTHVSSELDLATQQAAVTQDQVKLFLALGGGWQHTAHTQHQE